MHHPFTSPRDEDIDKLEPIRQPCAQRHMMVLNGVELAAVRYEFIARDAEPDISRAGSVGG
jgi:aspartyl-tRNA synthetase